MSCAIMTKNNTTTSMFKHNLRNSCRYYLEHYVKMGKFASRMKFVLRRMWGFGDFCIYLQSFYIILSCTRQIESELSLRSFAKYLHRF